MNIIGYITSAVELLVWAVEEDTGLLDQTVPGREFNLRMKIYI